MRYVKLVSTLLGLVLFTFLAGQSFSQLKEPSSYDGCGRYDSAIAALKSENSLTLSQVASDGIRTRISEIRQQAEDDAECMPKDESDDSDDSTDEATETDESEQIEDSQAVTTDEPSFPHFFFYSEDKIGARDFGPTIDGDTEEEKVAEYQRRMALDPALLCITAHRVLGSSDLPGGSVYGCTVQLADDQAAHDSLYDKVWEQVKSIKVIEKGPQAGEPAHVVNSTYMVDVDGYPSGMVVHDVHRPERYEVFDIRLKDGRAVHARLLCGGQIEDDIVSPPQASPAQPTGPAPTPAQPTGQPPAAEEETTPEEETEEETTPEDELEVKEPNQDPQNQGNIPEQVGDGDDTLPSAEECLNGGIRNRDGVCELPSDPGVEPGDEDDVYTPPAPPSTEPGDGDDTEAPGDGDDGDSGNDDGSDIPEDEGTDDDAVTGGPDDDCAVCG